MKHEVTIPLMYLQAARLFTAKKDIRPALHGVVIRDGYIAGTQGHYVGAIRWADLEGVDEVIVPNDAIDFYLKKVKAFKINTVTIRWERAEGKPATGELTNGPVVEQFRPIDARFPPFERLLCTHTEPTGHPQFQWSYLVLFEKAAATLGRTGDAKILVIPNGDNGSARVKVLGFPDFEGVVLPVRPTEYADTYAALQVDDLI